MFKKSAPIFGLILCLGILTLGCARGVEEVPATTTTTTTITTTTTSTTTTTILLTISGKVATSAGASVEGAVIILTGASTELSTTDANGLYSFAELPPGTYSLSCETHIVVPTNPSITLETASKDQNFVGNFKILRRANPAQENLMALTFKSTSDATATLEAMAVGENNTVLFTADGGITWTDKTNTGPYSSGVTISVVFPGYWVLANAPSKEGRWSSDNGNTWTSDFPGHGVFTMEASILDMDGAALSVVNNNIVVYSDQLGGAYNKTPSGYSDRIRGIASNYSQETFLYVGKNGLIINNNTWEAAGWNPITISPTTANNLNRARLGSNATEAYVVGDGGTFITVSGLPSSPSATKMDLGDFSIDLNGIGTSFLGDKLTLLVVGDQGLILKKL